ncbi:type VI secretion protein VasK, partial [Pseudomonas guariconensis]|nr:type VI secretion protein VasK [Pseudomonas mosselii]MCO7608407.1 type VI secretion protein VasK [Pseudomonas guariconensis]MCO7619894.1 type VI secretion protein VasK [Pseudomonas guariconensis]MCO7643716.1 type VI secretion protein VasK [Pseudomonas sp. S 311-6]
MVVDKAVSERSAFSAGLVYCLVVTMLVALGGLLYVLYGDRLELPRVPLKVLLLRGLGIWLVLCLLCPVYLKAWRALAIGQAVQMTGSTEQEEGSAAASTKPDERVGRLREHLHDTFGLFWRRHVRVLLVVGEPDEIEALAPGLAQAQWLEGRGALLLWGGSLNGEWQSTWPKCLRQLSWWRPLDGIVWAVTGEQAGNGESLDGGVRRLRGMARQLRWQAPLYLWQVCPSQWDQSGREGQAVGCLLPAKATAEQIEASLRNLVVPLRERGLKQMRQARAHDFLLRLSRDLELSGIRQWRDALAPLLPSFARGVPLRGLLFAAPQQPATESTLRHAWWPSPDWEAIREDREARAGTWGWTWLRGLRTAALCLAGLCALALLLSFANNRNQIATLQTALAAIDQPGGDPAAQLSALHELTRELSRLDYRREHGEPWYLRFGLSQNDALLAVLWPRYAQAN